MLPIKSTHNVGTGTHFVHKQIGVCLYSTRHSSRTNREGLRYPKKTWLLRSLHQQTIQPTVGQSNLSTCDGECCFKQGMGDYVYFCINFQVVKKTYHKTMKTHSMSTIYHPSTTPRHDVFKTGHSGHIMIHNNTSNKNTASIIRYFHASICTQHHFTI
nr:hypothetical protein BgiMline_007004 [Biomphalaria glabrata]